MALGQRIAAGLGLVAPRATVTAAPDSVTPPARSAWDDTQAITIDAVYRAIQILTTAVSQLSLDAETTTGRVARPAILDEPTRGRTLTEVLAETTTSLATRGEAIWLKTLNPAGTVINVETRDTAKVAVTRDKQGHPRWTIDGQTYGRDRIEHLQLHRRPGQLRGLGPLQACRETVQGARDLRRWADTWLEESSTPNGILKTPEDIDTATATRYKKKWLESVSYRKGPVVLGSGLDYKPLLITPEEMQWLSAQKLNTVAIGRMFGIPARLMLASIEGTSTTYANAEQDDIAFVRYTLMAYLLEIEAAFTRMLPPGQRARFTVDDLLRTDTLTRYRAYKIGLDAGWLDLAAIKHQERLP